MQKGTPVKDYPQSVLKLIDALRKDYFTSTDKLSSMNYFRSFNWDTAKRYSAEKFLIIFTLNDKVPAYTPATITQINKTQVKPKSDIPKNLFASIILQESKTGHRFFIKKISKYLFGMLRDQDDDVYIASDVGIKLIENKNSVEVIFCSTLNTAYRKINRELFNRFFTPGCRSIDTFKLNIEEPKFASTSSSGRRDEIHPNDCEWDVSEYAEADGSVSLKNLLRLPDFETSIVGYVFKFQGEPSSQFYLKLKDETLIESINIYVRCQNNPREIMKQFKEGNKYRFTRVFKMISKKVQIYYTWNFNATNMEVLETQEISLKDQETILFDKLSSSFMRDIPVTRIYRRKIKLTGFISTILSLKFDLCCRGCNQSCQRSSDCHCREPTPFLKADFFAIFQDATGLGYITAKNDRVCELLGFNTEDTNKIKKHCLMNGKVDFSRRDIEYHENSRHGELIAGLSKRIERKTIIGVARCNTSRGIEDDDSTKKQTIIPTQMCDTEKRFFINGTIYRGGFNEEASAPRFVPYIKVIKVQRFNTMKECYNIINHFQNLKKPSNEAK